jgi:hypothetical protein
VLVRRRVTRAWINEYGCGEERKKLAGKMYLDLEHRDCDCVYACL